MDKGLLRRKGRCVIIDNPYYEDGNGEQYQSILWTYPYRTRDSISRYTEEWIALYYRRIGFNL